MFVDDSTKWDALKSRKQPANKRLIDVEVFVETFRAKLAISHKITLFRSARPFRDAEVHEPD